MIFQTHFQGHNAVVMRFCCLKPKFITLYGMEDVTPVITMYSNLLESREVVEGKLMVWKHLWSEGSVFSIPETALDALSVCRRDFYSNIHILLHIMATLPVTTATAEPSFSMLKHPKTYLRSTTDQVRLTELALWHVQREVPVSVDKVIDQFASSNRCLDFIV